MINLRNKPRGQQGYAILAMAAMVLIVITMIAIYSSKVIVREHQTDGQSYRSEQAFQAAQAGLDYALVYLNKNKSSIKSGDTVSDDLPDKSSFKATYTSSIPDEFTINVIGQSSDFSVTRVIEQSVKKPSSQEPINNNDYAKVVGTWNDLGEQ